VKSRTKRTMTEIFNKQSVKSFRSELRNSATPAERRLWGYIRNRKIHNCRFRRQYSIGQYILDFYCPALRFGIELDGDSHEGDEANSYDVGRTRYLEGLGIKILRFNNKDVMTQSEAVVIAITSRIEQLTVGGAGRETNARVVTPSNLPLRKGEALAGGARPSANEVLI